MDPQRGHMVIAATRPKLFGASDGTLVVTLVASGRLPGAPHGRPAAIPDPTPHDSLDAEQHVADITHMSHDSARTYMEFHTGMRWLRRDSDAARASSRYGVVVDSVKVSVLE